jgi:hypothetical protein
MIGMEWSVLELLADGREYTVGEVMASTSTERAHIERIRGAMQRLYERGYVDKRGRGLHFFRITEEGRDCLFARACGVLL